MLTKGHEGIEKEKETDEKEREREADSKFDTDEGGGSEHNQTNRKKMRDEMW